MPTPFTHLQTAQRLLVDDLTPENWRDLLATERSAFLLGNIAADATSNGALTREDTHFYTYTRPMMRPPWREMMGVHPTLQTPTTPAQRVFLAGYIAHLSVDEYWTMHMLAPHFALREWGESRSFRFMMLSVLLIYMDERDRALLQSWQPETLAGAHPDGWLPFIPDAALNDWRDFIYQQIKPGGTSHTLEVFGGRMNRTPAFLRAILDDPQQMQHGLWDNITPDTLADIERKMYAYAREQMTLFLQETAG
ncbi:MAG: hypothetical protein K8I60_21395 [Anaerolineae bacterium]|nr:hypothetical protein [Anaerolineae bacterium]